MGSGPSHSGSAPLLVAASSSAAATEVAAAVIRFSRFTEQHPEDAYTPDEAKLQWMKQLGWGIWQRWIEDEKRRLRRSSQWSVDESCLQNAGMADFEEGKPFHDWYIDHYVRLFRDWALNKRGQRDPFTSEADFERRAEDQVSWRIYEVEAREWVTECTKQAVVDDHVIEQWMTFYTHRECRKTLNPMEGEDCIVDWEERETWCPDFEACFRDKLESHKGDPVDLSKGGFQSELAERLVRECWQELGLVERFCSSFCADMDEIWTETIKPWVEQTHKPDLRRLSEERGLSSSQWEDIWGDVLRKMESNVTALCCGGGCRFESREEAVGWSKRKVAEWVDWARSRIRRTEPQDSSDDSQSEDKEEEEQKPELPQKCSSLARTFCNHWAPMNDSLQQMLDLVETTNSADEVDDNLVAELEAIQLQAANSIDIVFRSIEKIRKNCNPQGKQSRQSESVAIREAFSCEQNWENLDNLVRWNLRDFLIDEDCQPDRLINNSDGDEVVYFQKHEQSVRKIKGLLPKLNDAVGRVKKTCL